MTVFQAALDTIERLKTRQTPDEILGDLQSVSNSVGFDGFMMTGLPDPGDKIDGYLLLKGWNQAWTERYLARDFVQHDPVVAMVRSTTRPFMWSEATAAAEPTPLGAAVMNEAAEFGLLTGLSVPIYSTTGFQAVVSFAGGKIDISGEHKSMLHLVAIYAHNQLRDCYARDSAADRRSRRGRLSPREIECLRWAANGKTSWEIAQILNISNHTADGYLTSATRKLHAVNRIQAVAEGFRRGLIH